MTKVFLISDLHFGVKNGSMTWFRSQRDFIVNQLIPHIQEAKSEGEVLLLCLGDVFDSRASIPNIIGHEVKELFTKLANLTDVYILQGNHDSASPVERKYNTLQLVLGDIKGIHIISETEHLQIAGQDVVLLPWFEQEQLNLVEYTAQQPAQYIFTHADIIMGSPKLSVPVFSGHVHTPYINGNVRNIGSCFSLDFHDANQQRYYYIWDPEEDSLIRLPNKESIRFWRVYDSELLEKDWDKVGINDYIEIYIKYSILQDPLYTKQCEQLRKRFKNCWIITAPDELSQESVDFNLDMESIIEHSIPDELFEKFTYIKNKINESVES